MSRVDDAPAEETIPWPEMNGGLATTYRQWLAEQ
jgi:hypothetical protein